MFDDLDIKKEKKQDNNSSNVQKQNDIMVNNRVNISGRKPKQIAPPSPALSGFEQRMQKLHEKGRKRGKWFSVIGIAASFLIGLGTIYGGYYLLTEVIDITGKAGERVGSIPDIGRNGKNKLILFDEWKICDRDADCVETQKKCCDCNNGGAQTGINKQYFKEWEDAIKEKCQEIGCLTMVNCKEGKAVCEDGRCEFKAVESKKVVCPADTKICSDGSSVGRVLPDCEFAECPVVEEEEIIEEEIDAFNWQTYRNEKAGYKIKFPNEWQKSVCMNEVQFFLYSPSSEMENCDEPHGYSNDISIIGPGDSEPGNIKFAKESHEIFIDNIEATKYINVPQFGYDVSTPAKFVDMISIQNKQGKKIIINISVEKEIQEIIEQILSTFTLIDQDETADWQTYRNEEFGFEFKYPNTLLEPRKMEHNGDYSFASYPKEIGGDRLIIGYITKEIVDSSDTAECLKNLDNQNSELIKTLNTEAIINWTKFTGTKMPIGHACIQYFDGGIIFLTFYLINDESKLIFRELISTFKFLKDTDNDGLFDDEEAQYGTDINNPDSDGDGYLDGDEVKKGYNPMGEGRL